MGGAGAAAQAGDARLADALEGLLPVHALPVHGQGQVGIGGVLEVIFNDYRVPLASPGVGTGLNGLHLPGHAGVDVYPVAGGLGDDLAHGDQIALFHHRLRAALRAHHQRDDHLFGRLLQGHDGLAPGAFLMGGGVYPA